MSYDRLHRRGILRSIGAGGLGFVSAGCIESSTDSSDSSDGDGDGAYTEGDQNSGGISSSSPNDDSQRSAPQATIETVAPKIGELGVTMLEVHFDYRVFGSPGSSPSLAVTDGLGEQIYSEIQNDTPPVEIELSPEQIADGGTYEFTISYGGETLDSVTKEYSGFEVTIENTNLDGMQLGEYSSWPEEDPVITISNDGDLPAEIDEILITVGQTPLDAIFTIGSESMPAGSTQTFSASTLADLTPGEWETTVDVRKDEISLGRSSVTTEILPPESG